MNSIFSQSRDLSQSHKQIHALISLVKHLDLVKRAHTNTSTIAYIFVSVGTSIYLIRKQLFFFSRHGSLGFKSMFTLQLGVIRWPFIWPLFGNFKHTHTNANYTQTKIKTICGLYIFIVVVVEKRKP